MNGHAKIVAGKRRGGATARKKDLSAPSRAQPLQPRRPPTADAADLTPTDTRQRQRARPLPRHHAAAEPTPTPSPRPRRAHAATVPKPRPGPSCCRCQTGRCCASDRARDTARSASDRAHNAAPRPAHAPAAHEVRPDCGSGASGIRPGRSPSASPNPAPRLGPAHRRAQNRCGPACGTRPPSAAWLFARAVRRGAQPGPSLAWVGNRSLAHSRDPTSSSPRDSAPSPDAARHGNAAPAGFGCPPDLGARLRPGRLRDAGRGGPGA
ncbi:hypothetical protein B0I31_104204 [Saccharothrix carnea]|uniref:Uncharacterized protein n=1 Tax=Saccharothrix carnea TaxID=1280637 RepID=A0A2P8IBS9_SACCR|nr:hypothetical protein B0I31_104204 [Saccharothrix carnea]